MSLEDRAVFDGSRSLSSGPLAYVIAVVAIIAMGILLGTALSTARATHPVGLLLWLKFTVLSRAGPPPEVLPSSLRR